MAIDFSFPPDLEALRLRVREFGATIVDPWRIAQRMVDAYQRDGSTRAATGDLPL